MKIAKIALAVPLATLFDYLIAPDMQVIIGARVKVPFGSSTRTGIVVELAEYSTLELNQLKPITEKLDEQSLFSAELWKLLLWAANYYHCPLGMVLFRSLPTLLRKGKSSSPEKKWLWIKTSLVIDKPLYPRSKKLRDALAIFESKQSLTPQQCQLLQISPATIKRLHHDNLIAQQPIVEVEQDRSNKLQNNAYYFQPNPEQQLAITTINSQQTFKAFLLNGITGSGKTEVYLQSIEKIIKEGKQALVMVPEISLTPQTMQRFKRYFNVNIAMLHSNLSEAERLTIWQKSRVGKTSIIIGTRSAIFTPFKQLGIIIIDEEHDISYKQQDTFRYHGRDLALLRSKWLNIPIVMGSATPSLESLHNVATGKFQQLELSKRVGHSTLPSQSTIDLKGTKTQTALSLPLIQKIREHLALGNQVLIFLNRRGFAPVVLCHDCGWIAECTRCNHYFTLHQQTKILRCHHCGMQRKLPKQCPTCQSTKLTPIGIGTERLEKELPALFPDTTIVRIDSDTTRNKNSLEKQLEEINNGKAQLILGTQILAKGHHFPNVTLVALIEVDGALFSTDFRATEHFAQLYTQVAGRAGRGEKKGEVILQTYHPEHPLLRSLLTDSYTEFTNHLQEERKIAQLPPFSHQVCITCKSHDENSAKFFLEQVKEQFQKNITTQSNFWIMGPYPAIRFKQAGQYHWKILLQHPSRSALYNFIKKHIKLLPSLPQSNRVKWVVDIDPIEN